MDPDLARHSFSIGMFLDSIEAKIQLHTVITLDYILNQFIYYLGAISLGIFLNNLFNDFMHFFGVCYNPCYFDRSFHENGGLQHFHC